MLKITRDELPMEYCVYGGCLLCPLYPLLVVRKIDKNMGHPVLRARRDYKLSSLEELLSLLYEAENIMM